MKPKLHSFRFILATRHIVFAAACRQKATSIEAPIAIDPTLHKSEIQKWQSDRLASLTKDDGWLTLVGLFWLNEGENKFGSDPRNPVVLPKDKAPASPDRYGWRMVACE